jgi:hypothetical protein
VINAQRFLNIKTQQLAYFVRAFWNKRILYQELDLYFWDTMEEWSQVSQGESEGENQPSSQRERVFWYVLHQLHFWPEHNLLNDPVLRCDLDLCVTYLECQKKYPFSPDYVGARP